MRTATIRRTLRFGSGRVAIKKDESVRYHFFNETVWVYNIPQKGGIERLLYTFGTRKKARIYLKPC